MAELVEVPFGGARWLQLAIAIEWSIHDGNAALYHITVTTCFYSEQCVMDILRVPTFCD